MHTLTGRMRSRALISVLSALLVVLLTAQSVLAAVAWSAPVAPTMNYFANFGSALARTVSATSSYLHTQFTHDTDEHIGLYYSRGNATGSSWYTPRRLNPTVESAENGAIAAAGKTVYVAYTVGNHFDAGYLPSAPRALRVRVNTNHGTSSAWQAEKTFDTFVRTGRPAIAATSTRAFIAVTDADSGGITVMTNGGTNAEDVGWTGTTIDSTTRSAGADGFEGEPVVATAGSLVLVAWIDSDIGGLRAKVSNDYGATWPDDAMTLSSANVWGLSASAASGRLGLAWVQPGGVKAKFYKSGTWGSLKSVATFTATGTYKTGYATAIGVAGTGRAGIAWAACTTSKCEGGATKGVNLRWRETTDNGATWKTTITLASYTYGSSRRINDYPSVVMTSTPKRFVMWNALNSTFSTYKALVRVGSGTP